MKGFLISQINVLQQSLMKDKVYLQAFHRSQTHFPENVFPWNN